MIYNIKNSHGKCKPIAYEINSDGCWVCNSHRTNDNGYLRIRRNGRRWNWLQ